MAVGLAPNLKPRLLARIAELQGFVEGPDSILRTRKSELGMIAEAERLLRENSELSRILTEAVDRLVAGANLDIRNANLEALSVQRFSTVALLAVVALSLVSSTLIVWLYVGRNLIDRLTALSDSMLAVAGGKLETGIPTGGSDEIADMAEALAVFRNTEIEIRRTNLREIRDARRRLTDAIESISEGFSLYDADDRLVVCNSKYHEIMYPAGTKDFVRTGMPFETIVRSAAERGLIPDAEGRVDEWVASRMAVHRDPSGPIEILRRGERWVQISERMTEDGGVVAVYTDVTEIKLAERALSEKSEFLQLNQVITRAANEAASVEDAMQITLDRVCANTGWPVGHVYLFDEAAGDLAPTRIWHLDGPEQFETFRKVTEATRFATGVGLPGRVLASGEVVWISDVTEDSNFPRARLVAGIGVKGAFAFPVLVGPKVAAVLEFFSERTAEPNDPLLDVMAQIGTKLGRVIERTRAEEQLLAAKEQAEGATKAKSQFLANMSHELRTPLNVILGVTEMLQEDAAEHGLDEFLESLGHVSREGAHLLHLIEDILDLSKIEAGKLEIRPEDFDVAALVHDAAVAAQPLADNNANKLTVHCAEDIGTMHADPLRVRQVVLNLLSNACKFTENGEVGLKARRDCVEGEDWIVLKVSDSGIGMTPEQTDKLFEEFTQADSSMTRRFGGTGLGLAISRRLCRMLGGDISLTSTPDVGTDCIVRLPANVGADVGSNLVDGTGEQIPESQRHERQGRQR